MLRYFIWVRLGLVWIFGLRARTWNVVLFKLFFLNEKIRTKDLSKRQKKKQESYFLVHPHFDLVSSILALFAARKVAQMISEMIECYHLRYTYFTVPQKRWEGKLHFSFKWHTLSNFFEMSVKWIAQHDFNMFTWLK